MKPATQRSTKKRAYGFTLIELLVAISIIAILSVIGVVIFTSVHGAGRDARRKADVQAMATALEVNYNGAYQELTDPIFASGKKPSDPGEKSYFVDVPETGGYRVCAALEKNTALTCQIPSDICFCRDSQQDVYVVSQQTPEPPIDPAPTPPNMAGDYWKGRGVETTFSDVVAIDPANSNYVYFGYHDVGFFRSINGGDSFNQSNHALFQYAAIGIGATGIGGNVFDMVIDPANTDIIYASNNTWQLYTINNDTNYDGVLSKSINNGQTWTTIGGPPNLPPTLPRGQIWSIALDTSPSSPVDSRTIYVTSQNRAKTGAQSTDGVYRTTNGGTTWQQILGRTQINATDASQSARAKAVAIDTSRTRTGLPPVIIYAGFEGIRYSNPKLSDLGGLYRSIDEGATWEKKGANMIGHVDRIAINRTSPNIVYAAAGFLYDPGISGNLNHPPNTSYLGGIYKSTDYGDTWTQVLGCSPPQIGDCPNLEITYDEKSAIQAYSVAIDPVTPNIVYAAFGNDPSFDDYGAYGGVWKNVNNGARGDWENITNNGISLKSVHNITIDPSNTTTLYASTKGNGVFKSTNSGATWTNIGPGGGGHFPALAITPSSTIYAGLDVGGFYKSVYKPDDDDWGENYNILNRGLENYYVEDIVYDPDDPDKIFIITHGGPYKSTNGGLDWTQIRNGFPAVSLSRYTKPLSAIALDKNSDPKNRTLYVGVGQWRGAQIVAKTGRGEIWKSEDEGSSWQLINNGIYTGVGTSAAITRIAIDTTERDTDGRSKILYAATDKGLYKSTDAGANWAAINSNLPVYQDPTPPYGSTPYVRNVVIDPSNANNVYTVLYTKPNPTLNEYPWLGGVYKSENKGATWQAKNRGLQVDTKVNNETSNYLDLIIDYQNPQILYLGSTAWNNSAGIWKSIDGGDNWTQATIVDPDNPDSPTNIDIRPTKNWSGSSRYPPVAYALAMHPLDPLRLVFGNEFQLYATSDGGEYWSQINTDKE